MKLHHALSIGFLALGLLAGLDIAASTTPSALADPGASAPPPAPTVAPTKPPYVFPTPIFIPTLPPPTTAPGQPRPPAPTTAQGASSGARTYIVQPGDNAWTISQKVFGDGNKYQILLSANGMSASSTLRVGQTLIVPAIGGPAEPPATSEAAAPQSGSGSQTSPTKAAPAAQKDPANGARTPVPGSTSGAMPGSRYELALLALNLLSGILLTGSGVFGILSYSMFQRARRLEKITMMTRRIRATNY